SLGRGGAEVLLAEGLRVADHERFVFEYGYFLPWKDTLVPALRAQGAEVTCFAARSNQAILRSVRRVARFLRERDIDLVHAHLPLAGVVARLAGRKAGVPVVYTAHNLQERYSRVTRWLNRYTWKHQALALAVSKDVEDSIRRHVGNAVQVQTVLNGVNVQSFDRDSHNGSALRTDLGFPEETFVVGTVAVFRSQKKLDYWLGVARRVLNSVPEARFIVVGDGPERSTIEAKIKELQLQNAVHLAGLQEETRPYFAAMDVYLMTSEFEGLPIALLESMSMAVPPVVTAVGGIPEVVRHDQNGCLRRFGELDQLTDDVVRLARDDSLRFRLGQAARQTVVADFSMERMQRELEAIYDQVIERFSCQQDKKQAARTTAST
ncbi:MAG: glycosyltransferase, partial [Pirellulales bacterium]|nr:glycosyltransferase [Pirellulales bacterium]